MKKITVLFVLSLLVVLSVRPVLAESDHDFSEAMNIIEQKVPCSDLSDEQLEMIGDYFMELQHPGDQHEAMDEMMGGEGSENLRSMHIAMAKSAYCGESYGMMGYGGIMMGGTYQNYNGYPSMMNSGFSSNWNNVFFSNTITTLLLWVFLILGIAVFIKFLVKGNRK